VISAGDPGQLAAKLFAITPNQLGVIRYLLMVNSLRGINAFLI
jgi:hypothetical protein